MTRQPLKILAIETSCDETAAAVIEGAPRSEGHPPRIASNIIASQVKLHAKYGGVVPEVAAREHVPTIIPTIDLALKKARVKLAEINAIAVTQGPGLITSLLVGVETAKTLGLVLGKPVIPVNHLEAHIYANFTLGNNPPQSPLNLRGDETAGTSSQLKPPLNIRGGRGNYKKIFPSLILIVSGGHTLLVLMSGHPTGSASGGKNHGDYNVLGETVDDAAGEAFDKTAKLLGLGYPGGPALSKLARQGNPKAFDFPRPMINSRDLNFSFSGLKTAVLYEIQGSGSSPRIGEVSLPAGQAGRGRVKALGSTSPSQPPAAGEGGNISYSRRGIKADLAASIQQAIVDVLIAKTEQAIKKYQPKTIMLGGGVAANKLLRSRYKLLAKSYQLTCSIPPLPYCTDNAAMIGLAAYYRLKYIKTYKAFEVDPNLMLK